MYLGYALDGGDLGDYLVEFAVGRDEQLDAYLIEALLGVLLDIERPHGHLETAYDIHYAREYGRLHGGEHGESAEEVAAGGAVLPYDLLYPVGVFLEQPRRVGAGNPVYLYPFRPRDEAEHVVAEHGIAAFRELVVEPAHVLGVDNEYVVGIARVDLPALDGRGLLLMSGTVLRGPLLLLLPLDYEGLYVVDVHGLP